MSNESIFRMTGLATVAGEGWWDGFSGQESALRGGGFCAGSVGIFGFLTRCYFQEGKTNNVRLTSEKSRYLCQSGLHVIL